MGKRQKGRTNKGSDKPKRFKAESLEERILLSGTWVDADAADALDGSAGGDPIGPADPSDLLGGSDSGGDLFGGGGDPIDDVPAAIEIEGASVEENAPAGTVVGTATVADADPGDSFSFSLANDADGRFEIDADSGHVTVADGASLDHEAVAEHTITVVATDAEGVAVEQDITVTVSDLNEAPLDLVVTGTGGASVGPAEPQSFGFESSPVGSSPEQIQFGGGLTATVSQDNVKVSEIIEHEDGYGAVAGEGDRFWKLLGGETTLTFSEPVSEISFTYSDYDGWNTISATAGSQRLEIDTINSGVNNSVTMRAPDGEVFETLSFTWESGASDGLGIDSMVVTPAAAPVSMVPENAGPGDVVATASATDPDAGDTLTYSLTHDADGRFEIDADTGSITVADGAEFDQATTAMHTVTVVATDGSGVAVEQEITIGVGDASYAPDLSVSDAAGEEDQPIPLDINASVPDGGEIASVTISGVPEGSTLSAGTNNGDGSWTVDGDDVDGLSLTPPRDFSGQFDLEVSVQGREAGSVTEVDFSSATITDYGVHQDKAPQASIEDGGATLHLGGNTWKDIEFPYTITEDTILEFQFRADGEPEIAGIGFDTDEGQTESRTFKLHGTQGWGVDPGDEYAGDGQWQTFQIRVGDYFTGDMDKLTFIHDHDASSDSGESFFKNIRVYEERSVGTPDEATASLSVTVANAIDATGLEDEPIVLDIDTATPEGGAVESVTITGLPEGATLSAGIDNGDGSWTVDPDQLDDLSINPPPNYSGQFDIEVSVQARDPGSAVEVDFSSTEVTDYGVHQDKAPQASIEDGGATLHLGGNTWKDIEFPYTITEDTILEFQFRADGEPEIAGIGFDTDEGQTESRTFKLHGTQGWGVDPGDEYAGDGQWQTFQIRVGDYFTGDMDKLTFIHDHDASSDSGESFFKNIRVYEDGDTERIVETTSTLTIAVEAVADSPELSVPDAIGVADQPIPMTIGIELLDASESVHSVTISGMPEGSGLSAGVDNSDGSWSLAAEELNGLTLTPPPGFSGDFDLEVSATSTDGGAISEAATSTMRVSVEAAPELSPDPVTEPLPQPQPEAQERPDEARAENNGSPVQPQGVAQDEPKVTPEPADQGEQDPVLEPEAEPAPPPIPEPQTEPALKPRPEPAIQGDAGEPPASEPTDEPAPDGGVAQQAPAGTQDQPYQNSPPEVIQWPEDANLDILDPVAEVEQTLVDIELQSDEIGLTLGEGTTGGTNLGFVQVSEVAPLVPSEPERPDGVIPPPSPVVHEVVEDHASLRSRDLPDRDNGQISRAEPDEASNSTLRDQVSGSLGLIWGLVRSIGGTGTAESKQTESRSNGNRAD